MCKAVTNDNIKYLLPERLGGYRDNLWNNIGLYLFFKQIYMSAHAPFINVISNCHPKRVMEIGIDKGWGIDAIVKGAGNDIEYYGLDIFKRCENSSFTYTPKKFIEKKLRKLGIKKFQLFEGDTRITLPKVIQSLPKMDFIYIDGGHSYEVAKSDWENTRKLSHENTVTVFDDYQLEGVKKVVDEIIGYKLDFIEEHYFLRGFYRGKIEVRDTKVVAIKKNR